MSTSPEQEIKEGSDSNIEENESIGENTFIIQLIFNNIIIKINFQRATRQLPKNQKRKMRNQKKNQITCI